jgi:hypothetical protein
MSRRFAVAALYERRAFYGSTVTARRYGVTDLPAATTASTIPRHARYSFDSRKARFRA